MDAYTNPNSTYVAKAINQYDGLSKMREVYTDALSGADIITYDMLTIDTITGMLSGIASAFSGGNSSKFAALMKVEGHSSIAAGAATLRLALERILSSFNLPLSVVNDLIDYMLYNYASLVINFSQNMDWLYKHNSDAAVIVVIPCNSLSGIVLDINGIKINIGSIGNCLIDALTAYLVKGDPHADWYHLADCSGVNETCLEAYAQGKLSDPDYEDLWNYIIKNDLSTDTDLPAHYDEVKANIASVCALLNAPISIDFGSMDISNMDISNITSLVGDSKNALYAGIDADIDGINYLTVSAGLGDRLALIAQLATEERGLGVHPSAQCCLDKISVIASAFHSANTANSYYRVRLADFAVNVLGAAAGISTSKAAVTATLARYLTPIVNFRGLIKKAA